MIAATRAAASKGFLTKSMDERMIICKKTVFPKNLSYPVYCIQVKITGF